MRKSLVATLLVALAVPTGPSTAQTDVPVTHTIFVTGMEVKGATTADKLSPPTVNPKDISKGYGFKGLGEADKGNAQKWEVASYIFSPSFVTVRQGDTVKLVTFLVNGDEHEVWVTAPDGRRVVPASMWHRGREYSISFVAEQAGPYTLTCSSHAPTMAATFLVVPRK